MNAERRVSGMEMEAPTQAQGVAEGPTMSRALGALLTLPGPPGGRGGLFCGLLCPLGEKLGWGLPMVTVLPAPGAASGMDAPSPSPTGCRRAARVCLPLATPVELMPFYRLADGR